MTGGEGRFIDFNSRLPWMIGNASTPGLRQFSGDEALRVYRGIGDCGQWLSCEAGNPVPRLVGWRVRERPLTRGEPPLPEQGPVRRP